MFDPNKTEITTKILNYAKAATGRDIPIQFQPTIQYRIKTGDTRVLQFNPGAPGMRKDAKTVTVSVAPGLDPNTDTTPSAWKKKLEKVRVTLVVRTQRLADMPFAISSRPVTRAPRKCARKLRPCALPRAR